MLGKDEKVIHAWAEKCKGPGWSNDLVWLLVQGTDGRLRQESLQPHEQSDEIRLLLEFSDLISKKLTSLVREHVKEKKDA